MNYAYLNIHKCIYKKEAKIHKVLTVASLISAIMGGGILFFSSLPLNLTFKK